MKRFPNDCTKDCPHYSEYDLSIDDLVGSCALLQRSCDLCEGDFCFLLCPLKEEDSND